MRTLIENGVKTGNRTMFIVVGDNARDQVVNLHYLVSKASVQARPSVLWCYKKDLGFSSSREKRIKQKKAMFKKGLADPDMNDPFDLFISSTSIRYTYYSESHKVLGNTYGMMVLQDFEALTPNLLARTVETVAGGGVIVVLLRTMTSLRQLYTMAMDVHARFRKDESEDVAGRFNERFLLSLSVCPTCLVIDDELNILPVSSFARAIKPVDGHMVGEETSTQKELRELKASLADVHPVNELVSVAKTVDQAKAILTFIESITEKTLRSTVTLTAARGRGKSAALGVAMASAVAFGYSNIFVTSPTPENLTTLFEFVFKGFDALDYKEHVDYEILRSTNEDFNKAIVRVNIFRSHRQTIQYIQPQDYQKLGQAELVVIDEAAAIPLPFVKSLLGPYLVFLSSTINGYEGTGRSLSLKLIKQLREGSATGNSGGRVLREIKLSEPIRYSPGDQVEKWLNNLLCLDSTIVPPLPSGYPDPSVCQLYYVNRDTLFSFHKQAETFLQRMVALYVSSHYKNSPNDLLLMSDAPGHQLYVLLGPVDVTKNSLPEIMCVIQVALEGRILKDAVVSGLARGVHAPGDLIPWTIAQQFQDHDFGQLSGARIVRIATHPDYHRMGYGSRAVELLVKYYQGDIVNLNEHSEKAEEEDGEDEQDEATLQTETIKPRKKLPPLLAQLAERAPEKLHYVGVSYGVTLQLYRFWSKLSFLPAYMRLTANESTGEHTCVMLRELQTPGLEVETKAGWLRAFTTDFKRRFITLLGFEFRRFPASLALAVLKKEHYVELNKNEAISDDVVRADIKEFFTAYDMKRLHAYAHELVDYHLITDLLPALSRFYFLDRFGSAKVAPTQAQILLAMGLQYKTVEDTSKEMNIPVSQVLALFNKSIRRISHFIRGVQEDEAAEELEREAKSEGVDETPQEPIDKQARDDLLESMQIGAYSIKGSSADWKNALKGKKTLSSVTLTTAKAETTNAPPAPKRPAGKPKANKQKRARR